MAGPSLPTVGSTASRISNAAVHLLSEYTGRGPTKAKTVISRDLVVILLQETLTKAERSLASGGEQAIVLDVRRRFQEAMRDDLVAAVEVAMQRKVLAFMSTNSVNPDMAAEIFVLEPVPDDGIDVAESDEGYSTIS
jgi:uncharacterized protein YbcI